MQKHKYHFHLLAVVLWLLAIPTVIYAYTTFPKAWLEVLGLSLSVGHIWSILASHLNALLSVKAPYEHDNNNTVDAFDTKDGVECETTTVWA